MACGTPVVASDIAALREVAADAALYAPPLDVGALDRAIERALEDDRERERLRAAGPARAGLFTWDAAAETTAAALARAANGAHG